MTFDNNIYFYSRYVSNAADPSAPHSNGGSYLDVCGFFDLTAELNGESLGSVATKVVPYDSFNTMQEIYEELDEMEAFAKENTNLYVKQEVMGQSSGVIYDPMDIPYLIVAKDKNAVDKWLAFTEDAESDPSAVLAELEKTNGGKYSDLKVPVMYSNIHSNEVAATDGIMSFAWSLLNSASSDEDLTYTNLTGFTEAGESQLQSEMGEKGAEGSVAVPDLVKDKATYLGFLKAGNSASGNVDLDKYYNSVTESVDVDEMLDDVFFILVPEENVEGRTYITRTASNGYDLNRDNSFQTTSETAAMQKLIATYNPVSLMEFHGRITSFQVEPCDPPHEPNFEYDLLSDHLLESGEAFGIAAIANNENYNSYAMPQRDYLTYTGNGDETYWEDPWDDMSTSYTPQFAMLQGTLAYTVELPAYNDDTVDAVVYGCLGQSEYLAQNKISILTSQTQIFERGVNNANSDSYDQVGQYLTNQYDVEGAEIDIFRPEYTEEGENGNFYPECYVIPLDGDNQTNLQAAYDMLEWLSRNDVKINISKKKFTLNGVTYPKGTAVISMYQAKRSVANGALYDGTLITGWTVLYSEGITTFNETRGFDMVTVTKPAEYKTISASCSKSMDYDQTVSYLSTKGSWFTGTKKAEVIISNASEDSTAAVNALLKSGKTVAMVTDENSEYYGDFVCSYEDYLTISSDYVISATGIKSSAESFPEATIITKAPSVYINGASGKNSSGFVYTSQVGNYNWNYDRSAMSLMEFDTTSDLDSADVIVGASAPSNAAVEKINSGTPYIGYSNSATSDGNTKKYVSNVSRSRISGMDLLGSVTYPDKNLINSSYIMDDDSIMYGYGLGYFTSVPEGAEILVKMDNSTEPTEGFITASATSEQSLANYLDGSIQAFSYKGEGAAGTDINIALFANTLTNKVHQRDEYAFISNFIFSSMLGDETYTAATSGDDDKEETTSDRIAGSNRYETSLLIAEKLKDVLGVEKFDTVVVASGEGFADALAGTYLADINDAPILLVSDKTINSVTSYISKNASSGAKVYILGGTKAVSSNVDSKLENSGYKVQRLSGATRYDTNLEILKEAGVKSGDIAVVSGTNYADALSASATSTPVLLVPTELTKSQISYLSGLKKASFTIMGGTASVSAKVSETLETYGDIDRIQGANRYETSALIADAYSSSKEETVVLAYGLNFPDGLCGGVLASKLGAPMILISDAEYNYAASFVKAHGTTKATTLGGKGVISDSTVKAIL